MHVLDLALICDRMWYLLLDPDISSSTYFFETAEMFCQLLKLNSAE